MKQDSFSSPSLPLWTTMGGALGARKHQKCKIQGSRFALGTLLGSILQAHDGLEGFPKGFGRGLKRALLKKKWFLKDVPNEITTFRGSWVSQNLSESRHNAYFEL